VFCASSGYLAYSSITYAASKNAVHVSLWVMAAGIMVLIVLRLLPDKRPTTPLV
jgi:hypothetical protein